MGNFYSGLANGIQQGMNMVAQQRQMERADQRDKWAEEDHQYQVDTRNREEEVRKKLADLYSPDNETYGVINNFSDQPSGNVGAGSTPKPALSFADRQALTMRRDQAAAAISIMSKGFSPELAKDLSARQLEMAKTKDGQEAIKAVYGDPAAIKSLAPKLGLDPETTHYVNQEGKHLFTDKSGKMFDFTAYAVGNGIYEQLKQLDQAKTDAQTSEINGLKVKEAKFKDGNLKADHDLEVQVKKADIAYKGNMGRAAVEKASQTKTAKDPKIVESIEKMTPKDELGKSNPLHVSGAVAVYDAMEQTSGKNGRQPNESLAVRLFAQAYENEVSSFNKYNSELKAKGERPYKFSENVAVENAVKAAIQKLGK